jgi:hypothetical protein
VDTCGGLLVLRVAFSSLDDLYSHRLLFAGGSRGGSIRSEPERGDEVPSEDINHRSSEMDTPTEDQDDYEIALAQKSHVSKKLILIGKLI